MNRNLFLSMTLRATMANDGNGKEFERTLAPTALFPTPASTASTASTTSAYTALIAPATSTAIISHAVTNTP